MRLQWQYKLDMEELAEDAWQDVSGATGGAYAYMLDEENTG
jgi:hypothetical protein